jgi:hypothetical protein
MRRRVAARSRTNHDDNNDNGGGRYMGSVKIPRTLQAIQDEFAGREWAVTRQGLIVIAKKFASGKSDEDLLGNSGITAENTVNPTHAKIVRINAILREEVGK